MNRTTANVARLEPIFVVEAIDEEGFAWLHGPVRLTEAIRISEILAQQAAPGREPRILIPPELLRAGPGRI